MSTTWPVLTGGEAGSSRKTSRPATRWLTAGSEDTRGKRSARMLFAIRDVCVWPLSLGVTVSRSGP